MSSETWEGQRAEFRASDFRRIARDKLRGNWGLALGTSLLFWLCTFVAEGVASGISSVFTAGAAFPWALLADGNASFDSIARFIPAITTYSAVLTVFSLAASAVTSALTLGHNLFYVGLCNNRAELSDLFARFGIFFKAFGLMLFMGLFVFLWSLLLFVPGIIAAYRYSMAPYLMAQHPEMGIRDAVRESKRLMRGHKWRLFCLQLSFIGWAFLCIFTFGIGYLWLVPYVQTSTAAFYLDRTGQGIPLNVR
ncbi:MAG: DUF975 family protein [Clostridiaceae bacterium]|nr:DUF975 family protein [Eubacteriales bacterium]